MQKSILAPGSL